MTSHGAQNDAAFTRKAMQARLLGAEEERMLALAWRDHHCAKSLHRLITAYMRLAIATASKYRRYGAPMADLIQEAGVGLLKAAERFDPDRGVRFSTYASWWIKASVQEYVMRDWSLVRTGSTSAQKALFFNMRRVRARIERARGPATDGAAAHRIRQEIADEVGVSLRDVEMMEARLSASDFSLNAAQAAEDGREWIELIEDEDAIGAETAARNADMAKTHDWICEALGALTKREELIIRRRKLADQPETLEQLGGELGLSKERVRQLECQALRKMKSQLETRHGDAPALLAAAV